MFGAQSQVKALYIDSYLIVKSRLTRRIGNPLYARTITFPPRATIK
jgi:hypothetical protein